MSLPNKLLISVAFALCVTVLAMWMTSGRFDPAAGKSMFFGALIVAPLVVAAKNNVTGPVAIVAAFATYLFIAFLAVCFATRKKRAEPGE